MQNTLKEEYINKQSQKEYWALYQPNTLCPLSRLYYVFIKHALRVPGIAWTSHNNEPRLLMYFKRHVIGLTWLLDTNTNYLSLLPIFTFSPTLSAPLKAETIK